MVSYTSGRSSSSLLCYFEMTSYLFHQANWYDIKRSSPYLFTSIQAIKYNHQQKAWDRLIKPCWSSHAVMLLGVCNNTSPRASNTDAKSAKCLWNAEIYGASSHRWVSQTCWAHTLLLIASFILGRSPYTRDKACLITDLSASFKHPSPRKQSETFHGKLCHG